MALDKPRYDYELYICKDDGCQYLSGQPMGNGRRAFTNATRAVAELCAKEGRSRMVRLFGPTGDGQWGFLEARICHADGTITEHMSVTVPEPFFSGKKPEPVMFAATPNLECKNCIALDADPVSKLSMEQLRSIVESVRDILYRDEDGMLTRGKEWDSGLLVSIADVLTASGLRPEGV